MISVSPLYSRQKGNDHEDKIIQKVCHIIDFALFYHNT